VDPSATSWDERYRGKPAAVEPSELLVAFAEHLPARGRALDVACGAGRNSVFLAERGLWVVAVDASRQALEKGRELASQRGVRVSWLQADLRNHSLAPGAFDLVACFYYRDRALYASLRAALRPGGLLLYETYTQEQLRFSAGPKNPDHLLKPHELLEVFRDWRLIYYREAWRERGVAWVVARKP
jgi:SAM-dependent methyltransferase